LLERKGVKSFSAFLALILLPAAWGAAPEGPPRACKTAADCVFVREPICNALIAVTGGHETEWEAWKKGLTQRLAEEKHVCRPGVGERPESAYSLQCNSSHCDAVPKPVKP
jgi:hypothetical protein